jgi:hypothetical protein
LKKIFMAITKDDLDAFHQFAQGKLAGRGAESLHELATFGSMSIPRLSIMRRMSPRFRPRSVTWTTVTQAGLQKW